ncbi:MAG: phosphoribosylformylglycinamidine synthase [Magnetococcales bacterium]|nr:phosphoribosylformylglycinamidine synthase [Magnetococcales bacterium]
MSTDNRLFVLREGPRSLSAFRLGRLRQAVGELLPPEGGLTGRFIHLLRLERGLSPEEEATLSRLLHYGPREEACEEPVSFSLWVMPRPGTRSPWSTKATDILQRCHLPVVRIERGSRYDFSGVADSAEFRREVAGLLHDRMTQVVLHAPDSLSELLDERPPGVLRRIPLMIHGVKALKEADRAMGLALAADEIDYLVEHYRRLGRDPTDVELMMFAQANSEHCRHKVFNAAWILEGEERTETLFGMIRHTEAVSGQGTILAYRDNAAIVEGGEGHWFHPDAREGRYAEVADTQHLIIKVETHNHPTAISPYPGAATGSGGEIRDEGATGRGSTPKAGLCGFSVSNLCLPQAHRPWEGDYGKPDRIASALEIMIEGPIGAAAFNNEFGRPNLLGYFRTLEAWVGGEMRGYHKPIMIAGGIGAISSHGLEKLPLPEGALIIQLGGAGLLIGLGGGAASSKTSGSSSEALDFSSVQRDNAEMQRRCQEVINRCWQAGETNPILSIHDVGAGGLANAVPELVHGGGVGARLELRDIPVDDTGMSPMEIWCNESQERYVLAITPERLGDFERLCRRERCPFHVIGTATREKRLVLTDRLTKTRPIDMDLEILLGKPPRMTRRATHRKVPLPPVILDGIELGEAVRRVLQLPSVAAKHFLITIGDRSVTGLVSRDQMVGPWQVPVADAAVTARAYRGYEGEAMAMGERTPVALVDAAASGRLAVGEALTNLVAADVTDLSRVKLSANWMAPVGHPGEDANLFDTVRAVGMELCPALGIGIPVGKDSLSMKTVWQEQGRERSVTAPLSLIVSAFAPVRDIRRTLTPQLRVEPDSLLVLVDLGMGRNRLGGSALSQVHGLVGGTPPDLDDPGRLKAFFAGVRQLAREGLIRSYHDRSDGGLLATLCEMAFAGHAGFRVELEPLGANPLEVLFAEELGAVLQIPASAWTRVARVLSAAGSLHRLGAPEAGDRLHFTWRGATLLDEDRVDLQRLWMETTWHLQSLRDNPECAREEYDALLDRADPGLSARLSFDPAEDITAPFIGSGVRPKVAILREQGVNGHVEMAAAFDRAGFDAVDCTMSDVRDGARDLSHFQGLVACGGFSFGDVLGAGEGWAKSILFDPRLRERFLDFFARGDTFALGVCNGCQMMSNLKEVIPGAAEWPRFVRNVSEQFEARLVMVEVQPTPSIFFRDMAGSRLPIVCSHGEGRAEFASDGADESLRRAGLVPLRYVDNHGREARRYPANPNGSPGGLAAVTSPDGRVTIMMPHPERVFRTCQLSWHPEEWGEESPWLRLFRNARSWLK